MKLYAVPLVRTEQKVQVGYYQSKVKYTEMEDGCKGVLMVFSNKRTAKKFCPKGSELIELEGDKYDVRSMD